METLTWVDCIRALLPLLLRLLWLAAMGPKSLKPRLMHAQPALG
jgi:hypothetical protein